MEWFCDRRYGFGEIMLALETSQGSSDYTAEGLLAMKTELGGWGQVWQYLGLIGPPDSVGRPGEAGPQDDAGPPDDTGQPDDPRPPDDAGPSGKGSRNN